MDQKIFNQAFSRATALMNDDRFNSIVESKANIYSGTNKGSEIGGGYNEFSNFEAMAFGAPSTPTAAPVSTPTYDVPSFSAPVGNSAANKLPAAILESFQKTPSMSGGGQEIVVDTRTPMPTKPIKTEAVVTPMPSNGGIDYSLIRMIVEESISKKINELSMLNESASMLKGLKFAEGNKIQFVDSKGNLYEGELKLKKRKK